ncbi:unnamed protein product [Triticum turgidum subsp. durum]|uniref:Uncharacterized protein n=1 Tax=Triticum turgidum subsp. durum TaxID=4567 RepID=A0A9R1QRT1_TRITD|nr:unnamed protein product [Triticum turgidum subsp. durum]
MAMSILGALKLAPSPPATAAQPAWLGSSSVRFHLANAGAAALVAASLLVADPALAFRVSCIAFVVVPVDRVSWRGD